MTVDIIFIPVVVSVIPSKLLLTLNDNISKQQMYNYFGKNHHL